MGTFPNKVQFEKTGNLAAKSIDSEWIGACVFVANVLFSVAVLGRTIESYCGHCKALVLNWLGMRIRSQGVWPFRSC